ncbi:MAG TPA: COX15/CtaA family protein [Acidimicrobiia bacterium]|nr:COX15/CtaA family protein [Acidimicrobiia bacterium]
MLDRLTISPTGYRRVTFVALFALGFIVVTGGAVRVTGSGLGCPDWPTCAQGRIVAPLEYHALVEFVNRTVTGTVSVMVIVAVLAALRRRPYRRDLVWLAVGLVVGVISQIVLGGLVVLFDLFPPLVMGHFVLSMILVANAVFLHHRAGWPDGPDCAPAGGGGGGPVVGGDPGLRSLGSWLVVWAAVVLFLGTVVTGSGPHAGSNEGQFVERLPFVVRDVARLHGTAVWILLALALYCVWRAHRDRAPADVMARGGVLLAVLCAQGAIGYIQYFTNVPAPLVAVHIAGATALWVAVLRFRLGLVSPTVTAPSATPHAAGAPVPNHA